MKFEWVLAATKWVQAFVTEENLDEACDTIGAPVVLASRQDSIADTKLSVTDFARTEYAAIRTSFLI